MNFIKDENDKLAQEYSLELPENENLSKELLEILDNKDTKIVLEKDIKNSYYVFLNNTIYIADNAKNNNLYTRVTLIAHECIHSVQSKILQILNYVFSNLEILYFLVLLILLFIVNNLNNIIVFIYIATAFFSMFIRMILEVHATVKSLYLGKQYTLKKIGDKKANVIEKCSKKYILKYFPFFIISLCVAKFVRIALIILLYVYKNST